nr:hypothetical protein [Tanacetum cinerariifolium]
AAGRTAVSAAAGSPAGPLGRADAGRCRLPRAAMGPRAGHARRQLQRWLRATLLATDAGRAGGGPAHLVVGGGRALRALALALPA